MIGYIIALCLSGLIVGALARLALPGRDPMSIFQTMLVGIAGSLAAASSTRCCSTATAAASSRRCCSRW